MVQFFNLDPWFPTWGALDISRGTGDFHQFKKIYAKVYN